MLVSGPALVLDHPSPGSAPGPAPGPGTGPGRHIGLALALVLALVLDLALILGLVPIQSLFFVLVAILAVVLVLLGDVVGGVHRSVFGASKTDLFALSGPSFLFSGPVVFV